MRALIASIAIVYLIEVGVVSVAHGWGRVEWRYGIKRRCEHRTGHTQRTRVAGGIYHSMTDHG